MVLYNLSMNANLDESRTIPIHELRHPSLVQVLGFRVYHKPCIITMTLVNKGIQYEVDIIHCLDFIKYPKGLVIVDYSFLYVLGL